MQIVWFKRDLRIHDHAALKAAITRGPVLPLYILEPDLWQQPDMSRRQFQFLSECLYSLDAALRDLGSGLVLKVGNAIDVLKDLQDRHGIDALWSHQETWNGWTYQRDLAVQDWCTAQKIPWHEPVQNGVVRRLRDRDGWAALWYQTMTRSLQTAPCAFASIVEPSDPLPSPARLGLREDGCLTPLKGGRSEGLALLQSFLHNRGEGYSRDMSSPVTAFESCSLLSAHLAFGTLSVREVFQATQTRKAELQSMPPRLRGKWPGALNAFSSRLRWHCHFIQKLEDEPELEFANMHPVYDGLREADFNPELFNAWKAGKTGYPMIDACMRALTATGWLNFRMRAMLMSFASYHLWLHWRETSLHLARLFTDYEPGIHYSQAQMQSGTTGINSIRIYNPIKQSKDHDPEGHFIRKWIPELADIPVNDLHEPWTSPLQMGDYPMPVVEEKQARKRAADRLYGLRKAPAHKHMANRIVRKHASRKRPSAKTKAAKEPSPQIEMPF